jgi:hypothetical protein
MSRLILFLLFLFGCSQKPHRETTADAPVDLRFDSRIEYPIITHYPEPNGTQADTRRLNPPGWGHYSAATTDHTAPSKEQVLRSVQRWENCPVDLFNHIDSLKSGVPRLQVINNVIIDQTLWTFFVGPNWKKNGDPYILVISGCTESASNNSTIYEETEPLKLTNYVAQSSYPFILAFVNQGGRKSQGNHPDVLKAIGNGIAFAKETFNIDPQRIVFAGKSRGGGSALIWGANPLNLNYKTIGIFAHAPPTNFGTIGYQPNGTFPLLGSLVTQELTGNSDWTAGTEYDKHMQILRDCTAGSQNPDTMKTRSPIAFIERYQNLYLAVGFNTHDPIIGPSQGFDFCQALDQAKIPYFAEFTLGGGHNQSQGVAQAFEQFTTAILKGHTPNNLPTGRTWNRVEIQSDQRHYHNTDDGSPVWAIFPQITTTQRKNAIYIGAPDGADIYLHAESVEDSTVWFDGDTQVKWDYVRIDLPPPPKPGHYRWLIAVSSVELPDSAIVARDSTGTLFLPETRVLETEQHIPELFDRSENARAFGHAWLWPY